MTGADEKKTRQIFTDLIAPHIIQQASDIKQTNIALSKIEAHLDKQNGSLAAHEKIIAENLPHKSINCVQEKVIQEIRDNMISRKAVISAIIVGIPLAAAIFGVISHFLK